MVALILVVAGCSVGNAPPPSGGFATAGTTAEPSAVASVAATAGTSASATAGAASGTGSAATLPAGGRTVTMQDDGTTIDLAVGERFLLDLGQGFDWTVEIADTSVVDRVRSISVIAGAQGVYEAKAAGRTTLSATGDPACRKANPPCGAPSRLVRIVLAVH